MSIIQLDITAELETEQKPEFSAPGLCTWSYVDEGITYAEDRLTREQEPTAASRVPRVHTHEGELPGTHETECCYDSRRGYMSMLARLRVSRRGRGSLQG